MARERSRAKATDPHRLWPVSQPACPCVPASHSTALALASFLFVWRRKHQRGVAGAVRSPGHHVSSSSRLKQRGAPRSHPCTEGAEAGAGAMLVASHVYPRLGALCGRQMTRNAALTLASEDRKRVNVGRKPIKTPRARRPTRQMPVALPPSSPLLAARCDIAISHRLCC
jgi:hypothetical protein